MKWSLTLWFLLTLAQGITAQQTGPEGEPFNPPTGGALWQHEASGIAFPAKLGVLRLEGGFRYATPQLGVSLRYVDTELRARADIYIYPCARPHGNADEVQAALRDEAGSVLGELEAMRQHGRYAAVSHDAATINAFELKNGDASGQITLPMHYTINEDTGAGVNPTRVESLLSLTIYQGHWVKLRCTFPAELGQKGEEARDEFAKQAFRCVIAADWEKELRALIASYRNDRLDKEAANAGSGILVFAEEFPLVDLTIGKSAVEFGEACEKRFPEAMTHVLRAFIVGATEAAMDGGTKARVVTSGAREVAALCAMWTKLDPEFAPPSLSEFEAAALKENKVELQATPPATKAKPDGK